MNGKLYVISGPSGVGKGTIVNMLLKRNKNLALSVSCTTRPARNGETDGINYFFLTKQEFLKLIEDGGLLEYSEHFGNYYGTPLSFVKQKLETCDVILEIEVDGALNVRSVYPEAVLIMIVPPSESELASRLRGRGTESEEVISERIKRASYELSKKDLYDYVVVNDDLGRAVAEVAAIMKVD